MPRYTVALTTPEQVAEQLNTVNPSIQDIPTSVAAAASGQYADFMRYTTRLCKEISAYIMTRCNRSFVPYTDVRTMTYRNAAYEDGNLLLDEDLLVPSTLAVGGVTIDDYYFLPSNALPYTLLNYDTSLVTGISNAYGAGYDIAGVWGYHTNLGQAWTVVQTGFSSTLNETVITVTNANAFETLQYIRADSEMMQIISRDSDANTLTVLRAVNGTTGAMHVATALYRYNVIDAIAFAATKLVAYYYQVRSDAGRTIQLPDGSVVISAMPDGVKEILDLYTRQARPRSVVRRFNAPPYYRYG